MLVAGVYQFVCGSVIALQANSDPTGIDKTTGAWAGAGAGVIKFRIPGPGPGPGSHFF